jgi:hypothetical protein
MTKTDYELTAHQQHQTLRKQSITIREFKTMQDYKTLVKELIEDHITDVIGWDKTKTRNEVLTELLDDTQDVFGNMTGSRTCNTYESQQFIDKSGAIWDDEILDLFADLGDDYFTETLKRGAETLDVVICELVAPQVIAEMLEA